MKNCCIALGMIGMPFCAACFHASHMQADASRMGKRRCAAEE